MISASGFCGGCSVSLSVMSELLLDEDCRCVHVEKEKERHDFPTHETTQ